MEFMISEEVIARKILEIRGIRVMLDRDLAALYGVDTKVLKQAVRRNIRRFPPDFMFELNPVEFKNLRSQIVTSKSGGTRYMPMAFTEQGVAMLSSILNSELAIEVSIGIIRVFIKIRQHLANNEALKKELSELKRISEERFQVVFEAMDQLINAGTAKDRKKIGFTVKEELAGFEA